MIKDIDGRIQRFLNRLRLPFRLLIGGVTAGKGVKKVTGEALAGEAVRDAELFQHYGFGSCPPAGTMGVAVALGGASSHAMIVATEHGAFGVDLATGEVSLYHREGHYVHLKNGRIVEVECDDYLVKCKRYQIDASEKTSINTPTLDASDNVNIGGLVTGKGGIAMSNERGGGRAARIAGTMEVSEDVVARGISQVGHVHKDSLGGQTSKPSA